MPTFTAFAVVTLLEQHFPDLVDYAFTARMEDDLDAIAAGQNDMEPWLARFYFGATTGGTEVSAPPGDGDASDGLGLKDLVEGNLGEIDAREVNSIPLGARRRRRARWSPASAGTARTSSAARATTSSAPASPTTWRPTS